MSLESERTFNDDERGVVIHNSELTHSRLECHAVCLWSECEMLLGLVA